MKKSPLSQIRLLAIVLAALACGAPYGWAQSPKTADPSAAELLFWETIRASTNPADFEEYLKQYPNGKFAGLARLRAQAKPAAQARPVAPSVLSPAPAVKRTLTPAEASALPLMGARWKYQYTDRKYPVGRKQVFDVRLDSVDGSMMNELLSPQGGSGAPIKTVLASEALSFTARPLPKTRTLLEFAPYLRLPDSRLAAPVRLEKGSGYPFSGNFQQEWQVTLKAFPEVAVTVPAGRFQASRVELKGSRGAPSVLYPTRFLLTMWYVPEVKRYVRMDHKTWTGATVSTDEVVELLEFSGVVPQ
jgi:hypothetical protein